jgi:hypothetical protein
MVLQAVASFAGAWSEAPVTAFPINLVANLAFSAQSSKTTKKLMVAATSVAAAIREARGKGLFGVLSFIGKLLPSKYLTPIPPPPDYLLTQWPLPGGSTDWTGGAAPAGGTRTGFTILTMNDGKTYTVAHDLSEVQRRRDGHAVAPTGHAAWVSFDLPGSGNNVVLDVTKIAGVKADGEDATTIISGQYPPRGRSQGS